MRWLRAESLNGRILRNIGFGVVLAAACHALAAWQLYRAGSDLLVHHGLTGQAEDLADGLRFDAGGLPRLELQTHMQWGYDAYFRHLKYRVLDARGRVLLSSDGETTALVRDGEGFVAAPDRFATLRDGEPMHVVTVPANVQGRALWIQTARSDRFLARAEEAMLPKMVEAS
jgi:hypothetical protein